MKKPNNQIVRVLIVTLLTLFLFFGCKYSDGKKHTNPDVHQNDTDDPINIVIADCFKNPEPSLKLSDIADSISYLPLETNEDLIIDKIVSVNIIENGYLINDDFRSLLFFNRTGKFIWRIEQQGRGPYEYEILNPGIAIDQVSKEIIIPDRKKLLFFNLFGEFVKELKLPFYVDQIYVIHSGAYLVSNSNPYNRVLAGIINHEGVLIKEYYQYNLRQKIDDRGREAQFTNASIEPYGNTVLLNSGDTVWNINSNYKLEIRYVLDSRVKNNKGQTYNVSFNHLQDTLIGLFFMHQKYNVIYNTVDDTYFRIPGYGPSSAIVDDMDFGLDVSVWKEQNGIIIDALTPSKLLKMESGELRKESALIDIINNINENDNPVLRIIHIKK